MEMDVRICFKIPGEDITIRAKTVRELCRILIEGYSIPCIAHIWLNGRKFVFKLNVPFGGAI